MEGEVAIRGVVTVFTVSIFSEVARRVNGIRLYSIFVEESDKV